MKKAAILILAILLAAAALAGCGSGLGTNYMVRYDIEEEEAEALYFEMPETEVLEIFGLPHRTTHHMWDKEFDYFLKGGVLRIGFEDDQVMQRTIFNNSPYYPLSSEKNGQDYPVYMGDIKKLGESELGLIHSSATCESLIGQIGAPVSIIEFLLSDGTEVNSFGYYIDEDNSLQILYAASGKVVGAWILENGVTSIELVELTIQDYYGYVAH